MAGRGSPAILEKGEIGLGFFGGNLFIIICINYANPSQCPQSQPWSAFAEINEPGVYYFSSNYCTNIGSKNGIS